MIGLNNALTAPALPGIKQRNEIFDNLFYDTGSLTAEEKQNLSPLENHEGSIIVVSPKAANKAILEFDTVDEFLASSPRSVKALVVAGVGSSVIGTASLARNVANAYNIPVAGIVSGYGAADLLSEALGGWFFYGAADKYRLKVREAVDDFGSMINFNPFFPSMMPAAAPADNDKPQKTDIGALMEILESDALDLSLIVGHSKGNLLIDFALEKFSKDFSDNHKYFDNLHIVSLGAVTNFPPKFTNVYQFLGGIDWFGGLNSRLGLEHTTVPSAWHHLNTELPYHISIESLLKENVELS
ncbi:hypothetical protein SG34_000390 [Thalassomonas viridans]|uniref:Uncharacterized protein n=1 Tax=Thalassomonas viridans TaxID=137584 RepID=A0AAF0CA30_9GAMM|nr:hypothetical protein [Thalassomonas viridans]WDE05444.1 hypothetical protein SG34_000390 [Thalassomonas viridans]